MPTIWVAGEALIDLIHSSSGQPRAVVGGGPASTAKALARLGVKSFFIGGISNDEYGSLIESELLESGVDLSLVLRGVKPTAIANVLLDKDGKALYTFELENTTTFDFSSNWLPFGEPTVLHVGSVATLINPGATELFHWAKKLGTAVVFDPNVRPSIVNNQNLYRAAVEQWISISTVVKLSEDDLVWLYGSSEESVVKKWLDGGVQVVVVTRAEKGLRGYVKGSLVEVPAVLIEFVDSIGAGDTIGAVLAEGLAKYGESGLVEKLENVLIRAAKAASITCSRAGANPPWARELP